MSSPHSGDWLHALPVSSCGLRLDDEAIRVAIGLRLGTPLCAEHTCNCGAWVDCMGTHGLSCKLGTGRLARHQQLNDLVWRALERASIPSCREPRNLLRDSELRPDGLTLIRPWKEGKCLTWDVTVADTLAATYVSATSVKAGKAAARLAANKRDKLHYITLHYITSFQTPLTPTVTNGASTKSFKFSECELKKVSFQKFFEGISVCEFLKIGRKRIPCLRSGE